MDKPVVAIMYDFDKTLCTKDMQDYGFIPSLNLKPYEFWEKANVFGEAQQMDSILSYLYTMIEEKKKQGLPITRESLKKSGEEIVLYQGVKDWFERVNLYGAAQGVVVEHYVISSGLTDIIKGTSIAKQFKKIYACTYAYDEKGRILWPSRVVNYTMKTQYLFRINKGVLTETNDEDLNSSTPEAEKYIPLENMVYFGDGSTDVPSMKVVQQNGGTTIAVFGDDSKRKNAEKLFEDKRATFFVKADYSKGSRIEKIVEGIIDSLEVKNRLEDYR